MDRATAEKLCRVFATVDSGCTTCINSVCEVASQIFPEWVWVLDEEAPYNDNSLGSYPVVTVHAATTADPHADLPAGENDGH